MDQVGDSIKFKKIKWTITDIKISFPAMVAFYKYEVHRKYFGVWLRNTDLEYCIFPSRWKKYKKITSKNKDFYPSQLIGTN